MPDQIYRADYFIEQLRDAITATASILPACAPTLKIWRTSMRRCAAGCST
jgi:hypothetical protein